MDVRTLGPSSAMRNRAWRTVKRTRALAVHSRPTRGALPSVIIIGAQRAGTTSLHAYLSAHPQIRWPRLDKGTHYFATEFHRSQAWYRRHFPSQAQLTRHGQLTGEASPYYLFHPHAAERMAQVIPWVVVVAVLRDPVSRAWSHYHHEVARGNETLSFMEAVAAEPDRLAGLEEHLKLPAFRSANHRYHGYLARGRYTEQLERYLQYLPAEQVVVTETTELANDPQTQVDRITDQLGLARAQLPRADRHNARRYPPLDDGTRAWVATQFTAENERLYALLGRRFDWMTP